MKKILLAYDGGDPARHALDTAAELTLKFGASLSVVSVVPLRTGRAAMDPWDDSVVHAQELAEAKRLLQEKGVEADLMEPAGDPAKTIEHIAEEGGFDTIVMGSRGLGAMGRVLQGSVSEHVATHSDRTVIITH
jgi:nucleotide-binding universal stress UspA family protein